MNQTRRSFLNSMLAFLLAGLPPWGWSRVTNPKPESVDKWAIAMDRETGGHRPSESDLLKLEAPDIAEDGSIVPITIASELPNVDTIWVFVEKNPTPLAARFDLESSLDPFVSLRIKMNESCEVVAMIKSGDGYYSASKKVRVVVGGCG
jgi:thiosulfate oxidation carrier protein SoxY